MGSPSLGSGSVIINSGTNSSEARTQNMDSLGDDLESPDLAGKKRRGPRPGGADKSGRGLRHFSMKVCEKVESKGRTTHNEVADELIAEITHEESLLALPDQQQYDEKNIRRRVYDALNVLMAMEIISKDKKEIQWRGIPSSDIEDIELVKMVGIHNLIERNERLFQGTGSVPANGVALPFILVQTQPHATVEVEISEDMQLVHFDFNSTPFELHDDAFVLKSMRLSNMAKNIQSNKGGQGIVKSEHIEEESAAACVPHKRYASSFRNSASQSQLCCLPDKCSSSLPVPGILKARVKQEYHT
eukprot:c19603_g1_i1 orf=251-1156(+)